LAAHYGTRAVPLTQAAAALRRADLVVAATSAPAPIIDRRLVQSVLEARGGRPLHLVDLAVPRNVAPDVPALAGIHYYDIAALEGVTQASHAARAAEIPRAETIIDEELERFQGWLRQHEVAPTLRMLGELAAAARDAELQRVWRRLPDLSARERRVVESLAHNLAHRLLRTPMARLRAAAGSDRAGEYRTVLDQLFADDGARSDEQASDGRT
jgi:glutamyl-tRNA reductase